MRRCRKRSSHGRRSSGIVDGAARSRRRVRRAAVSPCRHARRAESDCRGGADDGARRPAPGARRRTPDPGSRIPDPPPAAPRLLTGRLSESVPADHAHEAAGAEGRRRAHAGRSGRPCQRAGGAGRAGCHQRPAFRRRRAGRSAGGRIRRRQRRHRAAAAPAQGRRVGQPRADGPRVRVPPAGRRDQRRALRRAGRPAVLRRAHLHPPQDHARSRRTTADLERGALSQGAGGDGPAVQRSAGGDHRRPCAGRAARIHDGGSRLPLSRLSGPAGRDDDVVPAEDDAGGGARAVSAVSRSRAAADRARARSDREARSRRVLPDRLGHRQLLPSGRHPRAGTRVGGQQRRVLQPRDHRRRSGRHGPAVRAVPVRGARRVAGHRSRSAERRSARAGDSAHLPEVRHVPGG